MTSSAVKRSIGSTTSFHIRDGRVIVSIVSYSCPSLVIIVSVSQFYIYLLWGQRPFSPSRGLLRDCTTSPMDRFTALLSTSPPIQLLPRGLAGQHLNKWLSLFQLDQLCTFYVYYFIYSQSGQKCPEKLRRMRWKLKRKHTCHDN